MVVSALPSPRFSSYVPNLESDSFGGVRSWFHNNKIFIVVLRMNDDTSSVYLAILWWPRCCCHWRFRSLLWGLKVRRSRFLHRISPDSDGIFDRSEAVSSSSIFDGTRLLFGCFTTSPSSLKSWTRSRTSSEIFWTIQKSSLGFKSSKESVFSPIFAGLWQNFLPK